MTSWGHAGLAFFTGGSPTPNNITVYTVTFPFLVEVNYHCVSAAATARSVARIGISDDDEWRHLVTRLALYVAFV